MSIKFWRVALALWLFLYALLAITNVRFELSGFLMGILAIVAGILLLMDR